jgi:hypothetical protein
MLYMVHLFHHLTLADLVLLARMVDHSTISLSACRTRALSTSPVAASVLPGRLAASTSCLTRSEAVQEWL